jgi:hypothetical protein
MSRTLGGLGALFDFDEDVVSGIALGNHLTREEYFAVGHTCSADSGPSPLAWDLSSASMSRSLGGLGALFDFDEEVVSGITLGNRFTREEYFAVGQGYAGPTAKFSSLARQLLYAMTATASSSKSIRAPRPPRVPIIKALERSQRKGPEARISAARVSDCKILLPGEMVAQCDATYDIFIEIK